MMWVVQTPTRRLNPLVWCTVLVGCSLMRLGNLHHRYLLEIVTLHASSASSVVANNYTLKDVAESHLTDLADVRPSRKLSMLVVLKGEMANHLSLVAHAYALKREMEQYLEARGRSVEFELIGQHQDHRKWAKTRKNLQSCFPHFFGHFNFEGGIWDNTHKMRIAQQEAWLQRHGGSMATTGLYGDPSWQSAAEHLVTLLDEQENSNDMAIQELSLANASLSLPFMTSLVLSYPDELMEKYYDELRDLLQFNDHDSYCCNQLASADETVLHVRNFGPHLLPLGFHLMDANQAAHEMLKDLPTGHRIALVAPQFGNERDNAVVEYQTAFEARGWTVRVIRGQSSTQDFCFLRRTKTELIGAKTSTYALWAGLLGNATRVRLYAMDSNWTRNAQSSLRGRILEHYQWKRNDLLDRLRFETYKG